MTPLGNPAMDALTQYLEQNRDRFVEDLRSVQYRPTDQSNHHRRSA